MAIRTFRGVRPVWIAALVFVAFSFVGRAEAVTVEAEGPPPVEACGQATNCASLEFDKFRGDGIGTITSSPAGLDCTYAGGVAGPKCKSTFAWNFGATRTVTVTKTPAANSLVVCGPAPQALPCAIPVTLFPGDIALLDAEFVLRTYSVTVTKSGSGTGTVTGTGINCGTDCNEAVKHGHKVSLTATANAGSQFKEWTGACNGQGAICNLNPIMQATSTTAVFELSTPGGGTTGGGTTGGGTTGGGAGGDVADSSVDARVVAVKVGRSRLGKRVVRVEVTGNETISLTLTLVRADKPLAIAKTGALKEGDRLVTLPVPTAVRKGKATLEIVFTDAAGNTQTVTRRLRLGKA